MLGLTGTSLQTHQVMKTMKRTMEKSRMNPWLNQTQRTKVCDLVKAKKCFEAQGLISSRNVDESIPLESVLENPIYSLVEQDEEVLETAPDAEASKDGEEEADSKQGPMGCMLCPNKVLKNEKMVEVHLSSKVCRSRSLAHV